MVMKDKLVKTNHKAFYYFMKKVGFFLFAVGTIAPLIAIPTYINYKFNTTNQPNNAEEVVEENNQEDLTNYEQQSL